MSERTLKTCASVCWQPVTVDRSLTQVFRKKTDLILTDGVALHRRCPSESSTSRTTSFLSSLIVERWRAEHELQFPMSMALVHMYRSELARSGRRKVAARRR